MKVAILRRRKLGMTSCKSISQFGNHDYDVIRSDKINRFNVNDYNLLIRWGCTSEFRSNIKTINKSKAIHIVNDKKRFRKICIENNISIPKTEFSENEEGIDLFNYPFIMRPRRHAQGKKLYFVTNDSEFSLALRNIGYDFYISEYIRKDAEIRVYCIGGYVVCVANKETENKNAIAWNHAQGESSFKNIRWDNWNLNACLLALKAMKVSGLYFGGVDIMIKDDAIYLLEINSACSLTSEYRQKCFAKAFDFTADIFNHTGDIIYNSLIPERIRSYKNIIHPNILNNRENNE
jgi:glutathione synthase/RimK-type ligase-like ATP-grasp enzyme